MPLFLSTHAHVYVTPLAAAMWLTGAVVLLCGALSLGRERGSRIGRLWFLSSVSLTWYLWSFGAVYASQDADTALWWARFAYIGVPFIPATVFHFSMRVLRVYERTRFLARAAWVLALGFAVLAQFTSLLIARVEHFSFGWYPQYGPAGVVFAAYAIFVTVAAQWSYWSELRKTPRGSRQYHRVRALAVAWLLAYLVMIDFLPMYGVPVMPLGFISLLAFTIVATYVVWRYRLVDLTSAIAAPQVFATLTDVLVVLDREGTIQLANAAAERAFGDGGTLLGRSATAVLGPEGDARPFAELLRTGRLPSDETIVGDPPNHHVYSWSTTVMHDYAGAPDAVVVVARDVMEHRHTEERLAHGAFHDPLTDLANRAALLAAIDRGLARARNGREAYQFALLLIDLDRFKMVNDSLGHTAGDELLKAVARRIQVRLRDGDTPARLSGDEFAIVLSDVHSLRQATRVADRILADLATPFSIQDRQVFASASVGIAISVAGAESAEELLRNADIALHRAKANGRMRYEIYDVAMHAKVVSELQLETDLRLALEHDEFEVFYQPIVAIDGRAIEGFEALARWQHPERGAIEPSRFIPLAEETGLIIGIGRRVMRDAFRQLRVWEEAFPERALTMSVNLSAKQLLQPDLVPDVAMILRKTGVQADHVRLEVTESVLIDNVEAAVAVFERLRELGVRLSMDDFGTGYSSLGNLHRFSMDTLKIDQSFIAGIEARGEEWEIVRTILALARNLGMSVVAEGVETSGQLDRLHELTCDHAQGYYFSEPVNAAAATALIVSGLSQPRVP